MPMKLYAHPDSYLTWKALIAAKYAGLDIERAGGGDSSGKIPVLETSQGCLFSSGAIARYLSRMNRPAGLYGHTLLEGGMIDSWIEFCTHQLEVPLCTWVLPAMGVLVAPPEVTEKAKEDVKSALSVLNNHLLHSTYMVGNQITLADISVCCALVDGMKHVMDANFRKPFGNLMRWFNLVTAQTEFNSVLGTVAILGGSAGGKQDAKPAAKKEAAPKKEAAAKKEAAPKKEAKGSPKAKPAAAPASGAKAGDLEKQIVDVGDEIRTLKEKLKADGLSGKKINEHEQVKSLVAKLQDLKSQHIAAPAEPAPKAEAKKEAGKKDKGGKKDEKAAAPAADAAEERKKKLKKVIKEGGKRGVEIEGAADMGGLQFFCTAVEFPDGDVDLLVESMKAMNKVCAPDEEERKGCSGHIGKMIFSAGVDQLAVVAYVPPEKQDALSGKEWLESVLALFGGKVLTDSKEMCTGVVMTNNDKGIFPLKIREPMILESNNYLRKKGLFPDNDDDSEEMVFGDDDFPSM
eukprot:TRINITY_DN3042_c0_g2_i2.p1 TRINITY_DN3042_c0_g2~~TRINITY_DN3042_c0_g2_i2.p1  ORF type:complete len:517 (+),score=224.74 TRINITY_DN3042_c0_g2_i2:78-1628(+)